MCRRGWVGLGFFGPSCGDFFILEKQWFWVVAGLSELGTTVLRGTAAGSASYLPAVPVCGEKVIASEIHLGRKVSHSIGACSGGDGVKVVDSAELC